FGDECVARGAKLRLANVCAGGLLETTYGMHDAAAAGINFEGSEHTPGARRKRRGDGEVAVEAVARAESIGCDLMTHRARDAVGGQRLESGRAGFGCDRQMCEDLSPAARRAR